jgi:hypothetical protein
VQFPPMRHDWQHHNFGFWIMGSPAVGVVGLPLYPKHKYDRKYSTITTLGFGSAAVETLLVICVHVALCVAPATFFNLTLMLPHFLEFPKLSNRVYGTFCRRYLIVSCC